METVLVTGGSGLIGTRLISLLNKEGYHVKTVTRRKAGTNADVYSWDVERQEIDLQAFEGVDHLVHMAGAGIADKRWTKKRRRELYNSRIKSAELLRTSLVKAGYRLKSFIGTSAIGYYGDRASDWLEEKNDPGDDFLARLCLEWESKSNEFKSLADRVVILRFGVVLAKEGGALPEIEKGIKLGIAAYLGDGKQYYSWIHIDDLCRIIVLSIKNAGMQGVYNAVAPHPIQNKGLTKAIARAKRISAITVPTPAFGLKLILGELSSAILSSQRCSADKIEKVGFEFQYPEVDSALAAIYR